MKKRTTSVTVPSETGYRGGNRLAIAKGVTEIQCSQIDPILYRKQTTITRKIIT